MIKVKYRQKEYTFEKALQVTELLKMLNLSPHSCLVVKDGELLSEQDVLQGDDQVEIFPLITGG